jgi:plastocyanin
MTRPRLVVLLAGLACALIVISGCGSSSKKSSTSTPAKSSTPSTATAPASGSAGGAGAPVKVSADPSGALTFTTKTLHAKAGKVTIQMANASSVPHSIAVEGNGVDKDSAQKQVSGGQTATVTATLKPGKYEFYCPVDGHKQAGMTGTLIVT